MIDCQVDYLYFSVVDAKEEQDKCFISDRGFKEQGEPECISGICKI